MMFGRRHKTVNVQTAQNLATDDDWVIVDVRTERERRQGSVPGSIHYSLDSLNQGLTQLKGKKVLAICRSGNRSGTALKILEQNEIEALNVRGGMIAWARAGLPVQKGT